MFARNIHYLVAPLFTSIFFFTLKDLIILLRDLIIDLILLYWTLVEQALVINYPINSIDLRRAACADLCWYNLAK